MRGDFNFTGFTSTDLSKAKAIMSMAGTAVKQALAVAIHVWQAKGIEYSEKVHYEKWFGAINPTRAERVKKVLWSIDHAWDLAGKNLTVRYNTGGTCTVSSLAVAGAPPGGWHDGSISTSGQFTQANTMHLCQKFIQAGLSFDGLNSLAHELSHIYGGTRDKRDVRYTTGKMYGEEACVYWAKQNPDKVIENADSYGYFVAYWFYRKTMTPTLLEVH